MGTTGQSITLANSIIGVGILAMPFCFQQCGVVLAAILLVLMGLVSRLSCYFLLKSAIIARRRNFEYLAFHVFGPMGKLGVEVGIIGFLMGTCIAYFVVVGDLGPQIIAKMFNINQSDTLRTSVMVIVSLVCVLPLGLLRNVDSLSNVSAATIGFYFCLVIKVITEAGAQLAAGDWHSRVEMWRPAGVLQCVPIFSMALFCQTQLFEIFESIPSQSLEKMNLVTKNAINICTAVYLTLGLFGYIAFNSQEISGNILMSLSPTMASDVIKLGFVMSLAFSFPLIIFPCRASLYSLLYGKVHGSHHEHGGRQSIPARWFRCLTGGIVAAALGASVALPGVERVLGLLGATVGVAVCLACPAACLLQLTRRPNTDRLLAKATVVLGLIIMVLGTYANLQATEKQVDKYDDKLITKERIDKIVEDFFDKMDKIDDGKPKDVKIDNKEDGSKANGDSVILPPNPVPPESNSNEKNNIQQKPVDNPILNEVPEAIIDKVSETHPKNLNKKLEGKLSTMENKEKKDELKPKEDIKTQQNDDKINMMKQQQLIETIKQHGEEQKELIKEQKEILNEIMKTKQEIQKNKNDVANEEAKKIAVESIKKIAHLALQSLGGVSDKPNPISADNKKTDNLEKLADDAVQEIAQKAAETIEAIKDTKEKLLVNDGASNIVKTNDLSGNNLNSAPVPSVLNINQQNVGVPQLVPESVNNNPSPVIGIVSPNVQNNMPSMNAEAKVKPPILQQIVEAANINQNISNQPSLNIQNDKKLNVSNTNNNKPANVKTIPESFGGLGKPVNNVAANSQSSINQNGQILPNAQVNQPKPNEPVAKELNEPVNQVAQNLNRINSLKNVPIPLAMNGNSQINLANNVPNINVANNVVQNAPANFQNNENLVQHNRQKREVVDCTEKSSLKPEDREICATLIDPPKVNVPENVIQQIIPNVDVDLVKLPDSLPISRNVIYHMSRSLKSIDGRRKR